MEAIIIIGLIDQTINYYLDLQSEKSSLSDALHIIHQLNGALHCLFQYISV